LKFNLFLAPSVFSRKAVLNKVISTILTTLVMTGATFLVTAAHKRTAHGSARVDTKTSSEVGNIPIGLTRKRPAFRKAINMLTEGAAANPGLVDYYNSVTSRVKGESIDGESHSRTSRKAAANNGQDASNDDVALAQMGTLSLDQSADSAALDDSQIAAEPQEERQNRFTVGDMNFETNAAIQYWTNYYASTLIGRRTMRIGMERSNAYLEMARAEFRKAGVPEDLVWLAFVESVWNPRAVSPAAAGGLWQFIPATATDYGLKVESGNDERNDPLKQTRVAATYLHDLHTLFGDWALAMAAYNSGEPRVMGAIVKNGRADFWELYDKHLLPKETCDYVPKILASIEVAGRAEGFGLPAQAEKASASQS
jgi:Transglycosylase SLT domain